MGSGGSGAGGTGGGGFSGFGSTKSPGGTGYGGDLGGYGTAGEMSTGAGGAAMMGYGNTGAGGSGRAGVSSFSGGGWNNAAMGTPMNFTNTGVYKNAPSSSSRPGVSGYSSQHQQQVANDIAAGYGPEGKPQPGQPGYGSTPSGPIGGVTSPGMPGGSSPGGFAVNSGGFQSPSRPTSVGGGSIGYGGNLGSLGPGAGGTFSGNRATGGGLNPGGPVGRF